MTYSLLPTICKAKCSGCGRCVAACPSHCLTLEVSGYRKFAHISLPHLCNSCARCVAECPLDAIMLSEGDKL